MTTTTHAPRYADSLTLASGKVVRLSDLRPDYKIRLHGSNRTIRVSDIPVTAGRLACGDIVRGIAFREGDQVFCETHQELERVKALV